jgi:hypothetical protein
MQISIFYNEYFLNKHKNQKSFKEKSDFVKI